MIIKERDEREHPETDKFSLAGAEAEKQMAFYLRRVFADDLDILVFNDLRFKDDTGDAAQLDHLVLHREGFVIIESKSVTSQVRINPQGEWDRFWNGHWQGMPSPIQQAKRQADFLRRALQSNRESLLDKALMGLLQPGFKNCSFDVLVAVSDKGSIKRSADFPEVTKADLVPEKIRAIVAKRKWDASLVNLKSDAPHYNYSDEELQRISRMLTEHHYPLIEDKGRSLKANYHAAPNDRPSPPVVCESAPVYTAQPVAPPPPPPAAQSSGGLGICNKCGEQCEILWGKYSYYWKCHACDNNMALKEVCPHCKAKMKLRKAKAKFFIGCETCKTEELYCEFVEE